MDQVVAQVVDRAMTTKEKTREYNTGLVKACVKAVVVESTDNIGSNAIRDAFMKANYKEGSLPEVNTNPVKVKVKKPKATVVPAATVVEVQSGKTTTITASIPAMEVTHYHECIGCGGTFEMTESDEKWFLDKGWPIPKRCKACRAKKAEANQLSTPTKAEGTTNTPEKENHHTCIECGKLFMMTETHEKWFTDKGLLVPTRCPNCVAKRKAEKAAAQ